MKNFIKWFGVIAFVAIIGFSFVSCVEPESENLEGTWYNGLMELKLNDGDFEQTVVISPSEANPDGLITSDSKGTYTTDGGKITVTTTSIYGGGMTGSLGIGFSTMFTLDDFEALDKETWYTYDEIKARMDAANNSDTFFPDGDGKVKALAALDSIFAPNTRDYTLDGNTLTIYNVDEEGEVTPNIYTRK
jgi:hypothetical protein